VSAGAAAPAQNLVWVPKAAEIAREAGARLREFLAQGVGDRVQGRRGPGDGSRPDGGEADPRAAGRGFPEHGVYGEEGTRERMEAEFRWYVTRWMDDELCAWVPQFCVSMGLDGARPE